MSKHIDVIMPTENQEGTESMVASWFKNVGDAVREHEPLLEISTDKVTMEISAPASGTLVEIVKVANDKINPGEVLGRISVVAVAEGTATTQKASGGSALSSSKISAPSQQTAELSPAVKKLLKDHGLSPSEIQGTGSGGRITVADVERAAANRTVSSGIPSRRVPHNHMRTAIAQHMTQSLLHTAPHVTSVFEADFSAIIDHRGKEKKNFEAKGAKLTFTAYFVAAAAKALQEVPEANSRWYDKELEFFDDCNIGVATALETEGLIVPVIHQAQSKSLLEIAQNLQDLTTRARESKLEKHEVQGGTFTISNHGVSGSLVATPIIINQPQSAILGIGKLEKRVKVIEINGREETVIRPCAYVTLTLDHRVLDGFQANKFLTTFVKEIESWR